jgi:S-adenosylmethionine-diacylglycerol 3-amino-3-carboxypropyl transferase
VEALLRPRDPAARAAFYRERWDGWRWRALFRVFFSRFVMGRLGRDPSFFDHVRGPVAERILARTRHALTALDPAANPYLQWILLGRHASALPLALRPEHFDAIRAGLDRLSWRCTGLEAALAESDANGFQRFNLSDVFEYVDEEHYRRTLMELTRVGALGARLAYWNMLVPRHRPPVLADRLVPLTDRARALFAVDKAFFYNDFVLEAVQ